MFPQVGRASIMSTDSKRTLAPILALLDKSDKDTVKEQSKLHSLLLMKIHTCCHFLIHLPH